MAMSSGIARICTYLQVAIVASALPLALLIFLVCIPFGWERARFAVEFFMFLSSIGIPFIGLVISWAWRAK